MAQIKFGTSGWRGIMCEDFIFDHVKVVTQAIADYLHAQGEADKGVVIGYDARFMGERFAHEAARVLAGASIRSMVCDRDTPTRIAPLTAALVVLTGCLGAICGPEFCRLIGVRDSTAMGLAVGTASHGIGTARMLEEDRLAGAVSGLAIGLNGLVTAFILPLLVTWFI